MKVLYRIIKDFLKKIREAYILRKYDDFSIENYFRKQGAIIGKNNRIMIRSLGQDPFLIKIGNHCSISPGVKFITHDGSGWIFTDEIPDLQRFGEIVIKDNCFIGINCIILPNVTIGPNSIVGAGSVVTRDVPPNTVVAGNPAKVINTIEEYKKKILHIWEEQKPYKYAIDLKKGVKYSPEYIQKIKNDNLSLLKEHLINIFNKKYKNN